MNRTLLLILCDFLLLNLLALTRWEQAEPERPATPSAVATDEPAVTATDDIVALMRESMTDLQAEQQAREAELQSSLSSTAEALAAREAALAQTAAQRDQLSTTLDETQRTAAQLREQYANEADRAAASAERVAQLQRDLERREEEMARQQRELNQLETQHAAAREEIQSLNVAVRVAEQEKTLLRETANTFQQQAENERQERIRVQETTTQLAQGVGELAERSAAITQEMRDYRPINANILFSEYLANRIPTAMAAVREGLLGDVTRNSDGRTVLVSDGTETVAILHLDDTPFNLYESASTWRQLSVTVTKGGQRVPVTSLRFLDVDPRVVALPVSPAQAAVLGVKTYRTAIDPFRFGEAVLISSEGRGYGEVPFKLDPRTPGYVQMDNRLIRALSGNYSPSRGDLVLSKSGELLGVMVNADFCVLVNSFAAMGTFPVGDLTGTDTKTTLERVQERAAGLAQPSRAR